MKNKLLSIVSGTILATMVLTACGNGNTNSAASTSPKVTTAPSTSVSPSTAPSPSASVSPSTAPSPSQSGAPAAATGKTEEVIVTATNFEFDKKEIHVKKGNTIKLTLKNGSGAHGIEIPDLNVKLAKAGTIEFTADKAGTFDFNCALMCGTGHDAMIGKLIVE
jgi:cytochrome c oxidase subunit 2